MNLNTFLSLPLLFASSLIFNVHAAEKPNILIINIDDLGWKDLGFMGSTYYENSEH